jgi:hypothetical protein
VGQGRRGLASAVRSAPHWPFSWASSSVWTTAPQPDSRACPGLAHAQIAYHGFTELSAEVRKVSRRLAPPLAAERPRLRTKLGVRPSAPVCVPLPGHVQRPPVQGRRLGCLRGCGRHLRHGEQPSLIHESSHRPCMRFGRMGWVWAAARQSADLICVASSLGAADRGTGGGGAAPSLPR